MTNITNGSAIPAEDHAAVAAKATNAAAARMTLLRDRARAALIAAQEEASKQLDDVKGHRDYLVYIHDAADLLRKHLAEADRALDKVLDDATLAEKRAAAAAARDAIMAALEAACNDKQLDGIEEFEDYLKYIRQIKHAINGEFAAWD